MRFYQVLIHDMRTMKRDMILLGSIFHCFDWGSLMIMKRPRSAIRCMNSCSLSLLSNTSNWKQNLFLMICMNPPVSQRQMAIFFFRCIGTWEHWCNCRDWHVPNWYFSWRRLSCQIFRDYWTVEEVQLSALSKCRVERLFSWCGQILMPRRNLLTDARFERQLDLELTTYSD